MAPPTNITHHHYTRSSRANGTITLVSAEAQERVDIGVILQKIRKNASSVAGSDTEREYLDAKGMTSKHFKKCQRIEASFIDGLSAICKCFYWKNQLIDCFSMTLTHLTV